MPESARLTLELDNNLAELTRMHAAVEAFCKANGIAGQAVFDLNLALEEIVVNIMRYAFREQAGEAICVRLTIAGDTVQGEVRDPGKAFDPLQMPPPDLTLGVDERKVGGLGIHFVKTLLDDVCYRRIRNENLLSFAKQCR